MDVAYANRDYDSSGLFTTALLSKKSVLANLFVSISGASDLNVMLAVANDALHRYQAAAGSCADTVYDVSVPGP